MSGSILIVPRTNRHDLRVTTGGVPSVWRVIGFKHSRDFAETVRARHMRFLSLWSPVGMMFLQYQYQAGDTVNNFYHRYHINLHPKVILAVLNRIVAVNLKNQRFGLPQQSEASSDLKPQIRLVQRNQREVLELLPIQQLTHRLFLRGERVEETQSRIQATQRKIPVRRFGGDSVENDSTNIVGPVNRVFRRILPVEQEPEHMVDRPSGRRLDSRIEDHITGTAQRPVSSTVDVHKITDHVIHEIDRRVIAMRERLGRV
jgi:hypothetical protein